MNRNRLFGANLRKARQAAGYDSAAKFADVLDIDPTRYRHWERGAAFPNVDYLALICQHLKVTSDKLLGIKIAA